MLNPPLLPAIPDWKRLLSYILPQHIQDFAQADGPKLEVYLINGHYSLAVGRVFYSDGLGYRPFSKGLEKLGKDAALNMESALFLGAGMGSGVHILQNKFQRERSFTLVDVNSTILQLCEESLGKVPSIRTTYVLGDAISFMEKCTEKYDFLSVDVFKEHVLPSEVLEREFLLHCQRALNSDGWILMNLLFKNHEHWIIFYQKISKIFIVEHIFDSKGTKVIVAHI